MKAKAPKSVNVSLRLPREVVKAFEQWAKDGILGSTKEEVMLHVIRHYLFITDVPLPKTKKMGKP